MAVTTQILRSYRRPRAVIRGLIEANRGDDRPEARGFIYMMAGLVIIYIGQIPDLSGNGLGLAAIPEHLAGEDGQPNAEQRMGGALLGIVFMMPLVLYALAAVTHLIARAVGGHGKAIDARLALFWSVLAISPLFLLRGMASVSQAASLVMVVNYLIAAGFLWIWLSGLFEAHRPDQEGAA